MMANIASTQVHDEVEATIMIEIAGEYYVGPGCLDQPELCKLLVLRSVFKPQPVVRKGHITRPPPTSALSPNPV